MMGGMKGNKKGNKMNNLNDYDGEGEDEELQHLSINNQRISVFTH